jgi:hypothetical protein
MVPAALLQPSPPAQVPVINMLVVPLYCVFEILVLLELLMFFCAKGQNSVRNIQKFVVFLALVPVVSSELPVVV